MGCSWVYVAASSAEVHRAAAAIRRVREEGLFVPYDWTPRVLAGGDVGDDGRVAYEELDAVRRSDFLWLLAPERGSTGAGFESGVAHASGVAVVVTGPHARRFFFSTLARATFLTDVEGLAWILERKR